VTLARPVLIVAAIAACGEAPPEAFAWSPSPNRLETPSASTTAIAQQRSAQERARMSDTLDASRLSAIVIAAERVAPAVVSVNVTRRARRAATRDWFFMPRGYEQLVQGLGSGFVVSPDGLVITNQHVTEGAEEIVVTTRDGTDYSATLLGEDPFTDIAVLRVEGAAMPTVTIGQSTDLMIGEWVVAIGNPYGYLLGNTEPSVTAGVVSAVGRNLIPSGDDQSIYVGMIQTDAAINPGNSGGPLVNALGEVVGVNSSIFSQSGGSVGIGFAIPVERALRVAAELERYGSVRRSWIGVSVAGSDRVREWKRTGGLAVTDVAPDGPAASAGVQANDVLVSASGRSLRTFLDWEAVKLDVSPGDTLDVVVRRDGRERVVSVPISDLPTTAAERVAVLGDMELITVTPAVRQERRIRSEGGALIYNIGERTQRSTGLREGDVVLQINRQRVSSADDVGDAFRRVAGRGAIRVYVERNGSLVITDFYVNVR
jgi:serine protease Do